MYSPRCLSPGEIATNAFEMMQLDLEANVKPAAAYVRMSTEHQRYSTENQRDAIEQYAKQHHLEIVRILLGRGKEWP